MKVYIVMGNDYPDAVFTTEAAAATYCSDKSAETPKLPGSRVPRIYWRWYAFELQGAINGPQAN